MAGEAEARELSRRTAQEVFDDHLRQAESGSVEEDLARNYDPRVAVLTSEGVFRGCDGLRALAARLRRELPGARFTYSMRRVEGEIALLEWSAEADGACARDGVDTFLIRGGRILVQTIHYRLVPGRPGTQVGPSGA